MSQTLTLNNIIYSYSSGTPAAVIGTTNKYITVATIEPTISAAGISYSVTTIENFAFDNCTSLASVIISNPHLITTISNNSFPNVKETIEDSNIIFFNTVSLDSLSLTWKTISTYYDIVNILPISNICFPAGTPITTNQGIIPIEKINPEVHTIHNKKIIGITKTITQDKYLVCFEKDTLGNNIPSQKTIISKNHNILYEGKMKQAKEFVGINDKIYKTKYKGEVLYNVLMEEHETMSVNNLICETLHPENGMAKLFRDIQKLNHEEQCELIKKYNNYVIKNKTFTSKK